MPLLLRIDASSRLQDSHSRELAEFFVKQWLSNNPEGSVVHRDLMKQQIPHISEETITGFYTPENKHNQVLKKATKLSDELISELISADTLLIATPMYNFSMPSALKAWIDQIVRMGKTFSFSPDTGFEGLVKHKRAYVLTATGAVFSTEDMQQLDFLSPYLKSLLSFLGFIDIDFLNIEGTTTDEFALEQSKEAARNKILSLGAS
jgi:FMN-dependent NADH-azoreductase